MRQVPVKVTQAAITILWVLFTFLLPRSAFGNQPNILWLIAEDIGKDLGCYGDPDAHTPNIDRFAAEARMYHNAFSSGTVCSPSRSAFCTGMYQTSFDAHHHRSHRDDGYRLPEGVRLISDRLREVGYFTANVKGLPVDLAFAGKGKTDWNFEPDGKPYDSSDWEDLKTHQPFYAQVNIGETHRFYEKFEENPTDPAKVTVPAYLPDHPITREDWALYHDSIQTLDQKVGKLLDLLKREGLDKNTVVFFFGDHGRECFRGKYYPYDQGYVVPLIVRWPGTISPGTASDDPISLIDVTATSLALAGIPIPANMHGRPFLGENVQPRDYVFCASDRCDEAIDRVRIVRDKRYRYMRNYHPERPYLQRLPYADSTNPNVNLMRRLFAEGKLTAGQAKFMALSRPVEELYDMEADPWEFNNPADDPMHAAALQRFRSILDQWIVDTDDRGSYPEDPEALARILKEHGEKIVRMFGENK